jgi:hypothetical protein
MDVDRSCRCARAAPSRSRHRRATADFPKSRAPAEKVKIGRSALLISLVKQGFGIVLYAFPARSYLTYIHIRDLLFYPLSSMLQSIGLRFPFWLKDVIALYAIPAGAIYRSSSVTTASDKESFNRDPDGLRLSLHEAATASSIDPHDLIYRVERSIADPSYRRYRSIRAAVIWPRVVFRTARNFSSAEDVRVPTPKCS